MTLDFTCKACDASFELELSDLLEESRLECPNCEARAPKSSVDGLTGAFDDLFVQLAALRRKFDVVLEVDSEDLPAPYDREGGRSRDEDADEDDDEALEADEGWEEEPVEAEEEDDER
jgi:hypothetical protein